MARSAGRLWIGDIGDNARVRTDIRNYWLSEPPTLGDRTVNARMLTLRYPDEAHDAEGMLVDDAMNGSSCSRNKARSRPAACTPSTSTVSETVTNSSSGS